MDHLLHIDTSAEACSIMLAADGIPRVHKINTDTRNQAANINNMIAEVLAEEQIEMSALKGISICAGPGSYTGLRIGMATAKGICYVNDIPLFAHNKLTLLANQAIKQHPGSEVYLATLIAREQEYFIAAYNAAGDEVIAPKHILESELTTVVGENKNISIIGNIEQKSIDELASRIIHILSGQILDLEAWAEYAYEEFLCNRSVNLALAEPFYLKQVYTHNSKKNN